MADFFFDIDTTPAEGNYTSNSKSLNPSIFVAVAAEGQEEVLYLTEIENIVKDKGGDVRIIILNNYYTNSQDAISLSHPKHRYKLIEQWRSFYASKFGISTEDEEWLICDRDSQNFKANQYNFYVQLAHENEHFHFIVSNPAFQLWLLLHFTNSIPVDEINSISTCKKRIKRIEKEIRSKIGSYQHGTLDWNKYVPYLRSAINNSKQYAEYTMEDLADKVGTHFFKLLEFVENKTGRIF